MANISTLNQNDNGSTSRSVINDNFTNLNNQVKIIYKSADETVNNSTTLQNDDHLILPVGANEVWAFTLCLLFRSGTTPDLKYAFTAPSGATVQFLSTIYFDSIGDGASTTVATIPGNGTTVTVVDTATGVITASNTAGNMTLQWAQNVQNSSDTKVLAGSYIIAHKLA